MTFGRGLQRLWPLAVLVRVVAVVVLVAGPWTDEPTELAGWDAERFQEIAERDGSAWNVESVEYPPGTVLILDAVAGQSVVETNRRIVLLAAGAELAIVVVTWRRLGAREAKAFLFLGLPLVPMGLVRLDLVVTAVAAAAAILLLEDRETSSPEATRRRHVGLAVAFGVLATVGAMIKLWPALLVAAAVAQRRLLAATTAVGLSVVAGVGWLVVTGNGLAPLDQVLSLRGATGWHVESVPGTVLGLMGSGQPRLELNAFRIGTLNQTVVTAGRAFAVAVIAALALTAFRGTAPGSGRHERIERCGLVMLGATAALIVTAPLLSPQFLLWLTPWGAMLTVERSGRPDRQLAGIIVVLAVAITLTGLTLGIFGPPGLTDTVPALLLTVRNLCLLAIPVLCLRRLASAASPVGQRGGSKLRPW